VIDFIGSMADHYQREKHPAAMCARWVASMSLFSRARFRRAANPSQLGSANPKPD
jgi:hypothetical protein